jgi:hypothetical protein
MTCDDCQAILIDMARGSGVDPTSRDEARRHAALCSRCGEQQQEQQWLTTQFRAIAVADTGRQAPERVEIAALAAWRAEYGVASGAKASASNAGASARRWMLPGVAVAGLAAAAVAMLFVWPSWSHGTSSAERASTTGTSVAAASNSQSKGADVPVARTEPPPMTAAPAASSEAASSEATPSEMTASQMRTPTPARVETVLARATGGSAEFLPLPYVEPLRSTEARHVVRVSMTSGDEMIIGVLPADRRNGQPFEADVLVGEDGIARAIRIVR